MRTPEIVVDELVIRPWRRSDAEAMTRACQDPELHRWLSGWPRPYELRHALEFIGTGRPGAFDLGIFAGDEVAGGISLHQIDERAGTAEIGYWSAAPARGRRVTERAARALCTWAFDEGLQRVDWRAAVGNHASRVTALRIGFRMIGIRPAPDKWLGALTPGDLTAAAQDLPFPVRRSARTFQAEPPVIAAAPVTLRRPEERDIPALVTAMNDPDVVTWFGVHLPYGAAEAESHVRDEVPRLWDRGEEAVFAIVDGRDAYQGEVDVRVTTRDPAVGEVGYLVSPRARGRGYAVAAVKAISRWAFEALGLSRLEIRAADGNDASVRVAVKAGFTVEGLMRQALMINGERHDARVASLLREEVV
ncbi:GNAT family N-acetyltransferase [Symbioplanes lichenis]|uniref:GNAT family N-acetyltransferase n=1 Tax=Symbioplanes lichenis TaxID=1629072 RepID=UPI002739A56D|nr:GNAT family N-acetyltransferase [Actinoplanes lichenis]